MINNVMLNTHTELCWEHDTVFVFPKYRAVTYDFNFLFYKRPV